MANDKRERQREARTARIEQERLEQERSRRNRMVAIIGGAVVAVLAVVVVAGLLSSDDGAEIVETADQAPVCPPEEGVDEPVLAFADAPPTCIDLETTYQATLATNQGDIVLELDPALDPVSVNNFVVLARYRYYDGVTFHRVIEDFVIQGGDPVGDPPGTGGPGYQFTGGTPVGGYEVGDVAMANRGDPTSNGAQFFIITGQNGASLPPLYSPLGQVVEGLDIALAIQSVETAGADQPVDDVIIESIVVESTG